MPGLLVGRSLVLGVDTCGPSGTVALAHVAASGEIELLGQKELAGRSYSATLISSVDELLRYGNAPLSEVAAIVVVNGPGSFTGVRVGVSAVKGLAEGRLAGVVQVSRLEVLAAKAGVACSAIDAHRHEVFLRIAVAEGSKELLAGREELARLGAPASGIAVSDEAAVQLLLEAWPGVKVVRSAAPTAADAIALCAPRIAAQDFIDIALLDGHYLRRSDAEIFGEKNTAPA